MAGPRWICTNFPFQLFTECSETDFQQKATDCLNIWSYTDIIHEKLSFHSFFLFQNGNTKRAYIHGQEGVLIEVACLLYSNCYHFSLILHDRLLYRPLYCPKKRQTAAIPLRKSDITLLVRGTDLFIQYFDDLYNARSSIHVLFYIVRNDSFGKLFFDILMDRAKSGVKVRLLLDWFGSRTVSKQLIQKARRNGVEVHYCNTPRLPFLFFTLQRRNHRKITVIDGKIGYVGAIILEKSTLTLIHFFLLGGTITCALKERGQPIYRAFFAGLETSDGGNRFR